MILCHFSQMFFVVSNYQFYSRRMNRSKSEMTSKFVLPGGVATNSEELRYLQRKLLQNHYENSSPQGQLQKSKRDFVNELTISRKSDEFQKAQGLSRYDDQTRQNEKQMRTALSNDLIEQMKTKNIKRVRERSDQKNEERVLTKNITGLDALQKEKQWHFNQKYKMQAQEDLKYRENKKIMDSMLSENEKALYKNRYSVGDLHQGLQRNSSYANPTKQYYYEMDKALKERDGKLTTNPEYLGYNSSFKITRKTENLPQLDFMQRGKNNYNQQQNFYQSIKDRECKQRQELKDVLLSQIRQKEFARKSEKQKEFNIPYTRQEYQGVHHPIYNPVDFRYAHDNRYVMKELGSIK